jgi:hypothetical protein
MICPRCGVTNSADRGSCTRCSGSLAPPAGRDQPAPPVIPIPITRRAELVTGRAPAAAPASVNEPAARAGTGTTVAGPDPGAAADLYLLATDRLTGQPPPPEGTLGQGGHQRAERPGRMAVGLSGV